MRVHLSELEAIITLLLERFKTSECEWVDIEDDYYWDIPSDERYDPYHEPKDLNLGQLTDDWEELLKLLDSSTEPINYAFVWLSAILRKIGEDFPK